MRPPRPQRGSLCSLLVAGFLVCPLWAVSPSRATSPFGAVPRPGRGAFHDFHTSLTQMQFEAKAQTVEVSIRMFTDDLETALTRENGGKPVRFGGPAKVDQLLEKYVRKHFIVADAQRKQRTWTYLGYEQEADAHWVYLEMPASGANTFRNIVIKQDILMELFEDQVNLINIQYNQQKKTLVFRNNQPVQAVSL